MYLLILLNQLIASLTHIIAKDITSYTEPALVLLFRALVASSCFGIYLLFFRKNKVPFKKKDIPILLILSAINIPINQFLFVESVKLTSAPNVSLAYSLSPVFVFILSSSILKEMPTAKKLLGILIAVTGTIVVISQNGIDFDSKGFLGDILALIASVSWAFYLLLGKNFTMKYGAIYSTSLVMIIGTFIFIPLFFITGNRFVVPNLTFIDWSKIFYLGIVTSVINYVVNYYVLKRMEATKLSIFTNLQPVLTTVLAILLLNYSLSPEFIIGSIGIIGGVYLTQRG